MFLIILFQFQSINDHYPVCVTRKHSNSFERGPVHKFISYRETKSFNETDFINEPEEQPWTVLNILRMLLLWFILIVIVRPLFLCL